MNSNIHYAQTTLANGTEVIVNDQSRVYFGDYYLVRLEIICRFRDTAALPAGDELPEYRRVLEKMGVPSAELETARESMLSDFLKNASDYLNSPGFPAKLATVSLFKNKKKTRNYLESCS